MAPPPTHDSAVSPCLHGCLIFLHRHFPTQSPLSRPLRLSPLSQQQNLPWDCSTIPVLQTPAAVPSRGSLSGVCMAVERIVCVSLIQFRLPQIVCFTFSLKCFSSDPNNCPIVGTGPLLQLPHPPRAGAVLLTLPFCPLLPSSYRVLHCSIYSFLGVRYSCPLSAGVLQALLFDDAFLMYLWREMYSTSSYSTILFSLQRYSLKGEYFQIHGLICSFQSNLRSTQQNLTLYET